MSAPPIAFARPELGDVPIVQETGIPSKQSMMGKGRSCLQERLEVLRFGKVYLSADRGFIPLLEAVKTNIALNPTVRLCYPILLFR